VKLVRPELITFDFFGTVINWQAGFQVGDKFDAVVDAQGRMEKERFRRYADIVADSLVEVCGFDRARAEAVGKNVGYFPFYADSRAALHRLMKIAPCAALTNSDLAHKAQILEHLGYLSGWTCAEEVGCYKPAREFWLRAKDRFGVEPGPSWWHVSAYGDYDLETATELGLTRVFVRRPHHRPGPHDVAVSDLGVLADRLDAEFPRREKFEYKIIDSRDTPHGGSFKEKSRDALEKYLAELGADGWEIIDLRITEQSERWSFIGVAKRAL
jgi:FMN phosphatase YigB (HAD superfamily)